MSQNSRAIESRRRFVRFHLLVGVFRRSSLLFITSQGRFPRNVSLVGEGLLIAGLEQVEFAEKQEKFTAHQTSPQATNMN